MSEKLLYTIKGINKSITKEEMQAVLQAHADLYYPQPIGETNEHTNQKKAQTKTYNRTVKKLQQAT